MRIVNRKEFLALPASTVFSMYEPYVFGDIAIKCETLSLDSIPLDDFVFQPIISALNCQSSDEFFKLLAQSEKDGIDIPMDFDCAERDGCYEVDQLFAIWSPQDVAALIERLKPCAEMKD